jgi:hypothetical protein
LGARSSGIKFRGPDQTSQSDAGVFNAEEKWWEWTLKLRQFGEPHLCSERNCKGVKEDSQQVPDVSKAEAGVDLASLPDITNPSCSISGMINSGEKTCRQSRRLHQRLGLHELAFEKSGTSRTDSSAEIDAILRRSID